MKDGSPTVKSIAVQTTFVSPSWFTRLKADSETARANWRLVAEGQDINWAEM